MACDPRLSSCVPSRFLDKLPAAPSMEGTPMAVIARLLLCLSGVVFFSLLLPESASAQICFSNNDCPADRECRSAGGLFFVCREIACNSNADCPAALRPCAGGACQSLPAGGGSSGAGIPQSGVGQACGPRRFGGGVIKSVGCKPGLQCTHGHCQRLPS
jgi:hypothetical protein